MLVSKKINYSVIFQVILFNVAVFLVTHFMITPIAFWLMESVLTQRNIGYTSLLSSYAFWVNGIARYAYLVVVLIAYSIMMRFFEKDKRYVPLLTKQPIIVPLIKGITLMAGILSIALISTIFIDHLVVSPLEFLSLSTLFITFCLDFLFKFANDLAEELAFRGYSITRLQDELGAHGAVLFSAIMFMAGHALYLPIPFFSYTTLNWFLCGLLFGYVFLITQSIYVTCGMHLANNVLFRFILNAGFVDIADSHFELMRTICSIVSILIAAFWYEKKSRLKK